MEEKLIREITNGRKIYEKIVIRIFKNLIIEIYKDGVRKGFNLAN